MLAKRGGLDLGKAYAAIRASSGNSFVHETETQLILSGSYDIGFTMDLACKDLGFAARHGPRARACRWSWPAWSSRPSSAPGSNWAVAAAWSTEDAGEELLEPALTGRAALLRPRARLSREPDNSEPAPELRKSRLTASGAAQFTKLN